MCIYSKELTDVSNSVVRYIQSDEKNIQSFKGFFCNLTFLSYSVDNTISSHNSLNSMSLETRKDFIARKKKTTELYHWEEHVKFYRDMPR